MDEPELHPLAQDLNKALSGTVVADLLSEFGRGMYFPKGVVAQTAEATKLATRFNATVGMATAHGEPLVLQAVRDAMPGLKVADIVSYAPTAGVPELRDAWLAEMRRKNPSLSSPVSHPAVTAGLTAGLSVVADLLIDPDTPVVVPDPHWGNYAFMLKHRRGTNLHLFPLFAPEGGRQVFNLDGMLKTASEAAATSGKVAVLLNFPNNPTGYSPSAQEAGGIVAGLTSLADSAAVLALLDDAYFGLFYEQDTFRESLFAPLATAHKRLLAVKIDGATKEDFAWGFRIGFLTYGGAGLNEASYSALVTKTMGAIRCSVSNSSRVAQSLLLAAMTSPTYETDKEAHFQELSARYREARSVLDSMTSDVLVALPFNSGYFMTFRVADGKAEALRQHLLQKRGIGTISIGDSFLRVAFSSVDTAQLRELYGEIFAGAAVV